MCSTRGRSVGLDSDPLRRPPPCAVTPSPPVSQFVKVVLDSTLETKKLKIPPRFVKSGPELSDIVTLETPVGFKREIGIKRVGDEVWFQDGWSEFAEHHSIKKGHMLLFDFRGDSSFRVLIFDMSATEAEYVRDFLRIDHSDDEMEDVGYGYGDGDGFLGSQGIKEEEDDIIDVSDVSVENDFKPASRSNPRSSTGKRKEIVSLIDDDSDVEVTELDELPQTRTGRDKNIRRPNSEPKRRVQRKNRDNRSKKTLTRNGRGQFTKCLDIEVLEEDEVVHKQGVSKPSNREKKHA